MAAFPADDPQHPLWRETDPAVDAALTAALPTAKPTERPGMIRTLLERGHGASLVHLVEHFDTWDSAEQRLIREAAERGLDGAIRTLIGRGNAQSCRHALHLIRHQRLTRLAYLLTELIRHGRGELPAEAAAVLVGLAREPGLEATARATLTAAVEGAVAGYDRHRHTGVLDAFLMLLPARMPVARSALLAEDHPAVIALRARLKQPTDATTRHALPALLTWPAMSEAAGAGLAFAARDAALGEALKHGHLLQDPAAQHALQQLHDTTPLLLDEVQRRKLSPQTRRWLPTLWAALPLSPGKLIQQLAALQHDDAPAVRIAALRHLLGLDTADLDNTARQQLAQALIRFAHDPHEPLARLAARALDRQSAPQNAVSNLARLADAPHASVRAAAGHRVGPSAFARLWDTDARLDPDHRAAALRALRKLDADFDRRLSQKLHAPPAQQIRALGWIHALSTPAVFDADTARLTGSDDEKVAASAVAALAHSHDPATLVLLESLAAHPNGRVRANAIEARAQRQAGETFRTQLVDALQDDTARPRANAIRALLDLDMESSLHALRDMLRDRRPDHRRSALWLAEASGMLDIARQSEAVRSEAATHPHTHSHTQDNKTQDPANPTATVHQLLADLFATDPDPAPGNQEAAA